MKDYMLIQTKENDVLRHIQERGEWYGFIVPERVMPSPYAKGTMAKPVKFTMASFQQNQYQLQDFVFPAMSDYSKELQRYKEKHCNERLGWEIAFYSEVTF